MFGPKWPPYVAKASEADAKQLTDFFVKVADSLMLDKHSNDLSAQIFFEKIKRSIDAVATASPGLHSYGLYSHGLASYGQYSDGLDSYGLYSDALDSYGLDSYGLKLYAERDRNAIS